MILLGFIYLFFIGVPLGLVFYLYSKYAKLGVSFFSALGVSYIVVLLTMTVLYFFASSFFIKHFFTGGLTSLLLSFIIIFVFLVLFIFFNWNLKHIVVLLIIEFAVVLLYAYLAFASSYFILNTFHPVPRYFCMYDDVDSRGACNQDGLVAAGDGVFERNGIFNPYLDFKITSGKLLLIKNPLTKDLEVVKFEKKEYYGDALNVIAVDSNGKTSTIQIMREDIKGVDF